MEPKVANSWTSSVPVLSSTNKAITLCLSATASGPNCSSHPGWHLYQAGLELNHHSCWN